jgi:membrane peptidoglycan carboxypeptidase
VEAAAALVIETQANKEHLLSLYLRTAYFGHGAFGLTDASETYFHKPVHELSLNEAALLSAVLPAPEHLSPYANLATAQGRLNRVLHRMHVSGYLSKEASMEAIAAGLPKSLLITGPRMQRSPPLLSGSGALEAQARIVLHAHSELASKFAVCWLRVCHGQRYCVLYRCT